MRRSPEATRAPGGGSHRSLWRAAALFLVALLAVGGSGLLLAAYTTGPPRPPQPAAEAAPPPWYADLGHSRPESRDGADGPAALARSVPVRIRIPAIGVDAKLITLGVDRDGEVEVPPLDEADDAGWYEPGVTPGEVGNAVIIGHVDSWEIGPAVFFELGALEPGDTIEVVRKDESVAEFRVDGVDSFPKTDFPAGLVYGPSDHPGLRVVTCGGKFDKKQGNYLDNVIVFATLAAG